MKPGIINPEQWNKDRLEGKTRRVLVILKEAPVDANFSLIDHLKNGGRGYTWNNIAMWVYLLRHFGKDDSEMSFQNASNKKNPKGRKLNLNHTAVININDSWKPSGNGKNSNDSELFDNYYIERDEEIRNFIEQIDPDIILCGGKVVAECLNKFRNLTNLSGNDAKFAKLYKLEGPNKEYNLISMPHPNIRFSQEILYNELFKTLTQYKELL